MVRPEVTAMTVRTYLIRFLAAVAATALLVTPALAADVTCWFPPGFAPESAKRITDALGASGISVEPRVARNYPEILDAFSAKGSNVAYVGSFVQAILAAKRQGVTLVQAIDGKQLYGAWMIHPKGEKPAAILGESPAKIAFAKGATSGETGAKAATDGKASVATASHAAAAEAVKSGKARAAFVKSWWWEANKAKFPDLDVHQVPGVSDARNPDNVLTASTQVDAGVRAKLKAAALAAPAAFGAKSMADFSGDLSFTIALMQKAKIDPVSYLFE
jgi:ABC-type phosphate/phosphonate transport system substrate-binding protein